MREEVERVNDNFTRKTNITDKAKDMLNIIKGHSLFNTENIVNSNFLSLISVIKDSKRPIMLHYKQIM